MNIDEILEHYTNQSSEFEKEALIRAIALYDEIARKVDASDTYPKEVRYQTLLNLKKTQDQWKKELESM